MRVLIWSCGFERRFAGVFIAEEMQRQGLNVAVTGSREHPENALAAFQEYKPDFVFSDVARAHCVPYYRKMREAGAKLVLWYPDMTECRRDRMWRTQLNNVADILIFSIMETATRYRELAPCVLWMPQYFDHIFCSKNNSGETIGLPKRLDPIKPISDIVFIGSVDDHRKRWLDELNKHYNCNFVIHVPGMLNEIRGWRMAEAYAQSRIAFNIQRALFINPGAFVTSNRAYNAMGSGAFFINHKVQHLNLMWQEGEHCVTYDDSFNGLRTAIDYYLMHEVEREQIARQGQKDILFFHTLEQRVKEYWRVMELFYTGQSDTIKTSFPGYGLWVKNGK